MANRACRSFHEAASTAISRVDGATRETTADSAADSDLNTK
jgi:hypothetical protein